MKSLSLILLILTISLIAISCSPDSPKSRKGILVWPRTIGEDNWPLIAKFARIDCERTGYGGKIVYLTTSIDGETIFEYAVNGTARGFMDRLGMKDAIDIMKEGTVPGDLSPLIKIGLKECDK